MPRKIPYHKPPGSDRERAAYERSDSRKADKAFYDLSPWRRLRKAILAGEPLCRRCTEQGRVKAAEHVHHVLERRDRPDLALDPDNLAPLCAECHNAVRHQGGRGSI